MKSLSKLKMLLLPALFAISLPVLASARLPLLAIQGQAKLNTLSAALLPGEIAQLPIRAFLNSPLEIHWCS